MRIFFRIQFAYGFEVGWIGMDRMAWYGMAWVVRMDRSGSLDEYTTRYVQGV
jgi:hypothetical protein